MNDFIEVRDQGVIVSAGDDGKCLIFDIRE